MHEMACAEEEMDLLCFLLEIRKQELGSGAVLLFLGARFWQQAQLSPCPALAEGRAGLVARDWKKKKKSSECIFFLLMPAFSFE